MCAAVALANIDIFEREDILGRVLEHEDRCCAAMLDVAARHADRGRRARRRVLLRGRAGQGPGHQGALQRPRVERLIRGFVGPELFSRGLICPRRRPLRPRDPAGAAADRGSGAVRRRSRTCCGPCWPRRARGWACHEDRCPDGDQDRRVPRGADAGRACASWSSAVTRWSCRAAPATARHRRRRLRLPGRGDRARRRGGVRRGRADGQGQGAAARRGRPARAAPRRCSPTCTWRPTPT